MAENTVMCRKVKTLPCSDAISLYGEMIKRFAARPHTREQAGVAAYNLANTLVKLGRQDLALAYYDKAVSVLENSGDAVNQTWCAMALVNKGDLFLRGGAPVKAVPCFDRVIEIFGGSRDQKLRTQVAMAYAKKSACVGMVGDAGAMELVLERVRELFGASDSSQILYWKAMAYLNAGRLAAHAEDRERSRRLYSDALQAFSQSDFADARTMETIVRSSFSGEG